MPSSGKSHAGKGRSLHLLAFSLAAIGYHFAESDRVPGKRRRADSARNESWNLSFSRRMARFSRQKTDGHISPRIPAAKPERKRRSLERFAKSNGRPWSSRQKRPAGREVLLIHHGNFAGRPDGADLGLFGFPRALWHPSHGHAAHHAVHAVHRIDSAHDLPPVARRLGPSRGRLRLDAVGLGNS